jgi:adenylate cyclase
VRIRNAAIPEDRRIEFRIGINVGDIIIDDGNIIAPRQTVQKMA